MLDYSNGTSRMETSRMEEQDIDDEVYDDNDEEEEESKKYTPVEKCSGERFVKHMERISKSKYRYIYRGYDNESGCEIAWSSYRLKD